MMGGERMGGKRRGGTGEGRRERAPLTQIPGSAPGSVSISWVRVTVVERWSLTGELLSCARRPTVFAFLAIFQV